MGSREAGYLSTIRSRCRFFCLSWLFLPACNLRLVWPLSSGVLRAPVGTNGSHLTRLQGGKPSLRPVVGHLPSTPQGLLQEQLSEQGRLWSREGGLGHHRRVSFGQGPEGGRV